MKLDSVQTALVDYDLERYPLPELVREQLGVPQLDEIHLTADYPLLTRENDQKTVFHERFYEIGDEFYRVYHQLLVDVVQPLFGENLIYQRVPTFRSIFRTTSQSERSIAIATTPTGKAR